MIYSEKGVLLLLLHNIVACTKDLLITNHQRCYAFILREEDKRCAFHASIIVGDEVLGKDYWQHSITRFGLFFAKKTKHPLGFE
jgi:hypothetical protein